MAKLTLNDVTNLQNETSVVTSINANNALIEAALENTFSLDGTTPNSMDANLDMNSHTVFNLPEATSDTEPVRKLEYDLALATTATDRALAEAARDDAQASASAAATSETNAGTSATAAATAEANSETARDAARDWAEAPEDTAVDDGVNPPGNSAFHWSKKAEIASAKITADQTITVPGDFATPLAAWQYLQGYQIATGVTVTVTIADGDYVHDEAITGHPQGGQIHFEGAALVGGFPTSDDFVITGSDSTSRATDNAAHLTMLKTHFPVSIECQVGAVDIRHGGAGPQLDSVLFWTDNTNVNVGAYLYLSQSYWANVAFHGFGNDGIVVTNSGNIRVTNISVSGCSGFGYQSSDVSDIKSTSGLIACSNGSNGVYVKRMGCMEAHSAVSKGNGGNGFVVDDSGSLECASAYSYKNASAGYLAVNGGILSCSGAEAEANGTFGFYANAKGELTALTTVATDNTLQSYIATGCGLIYATNATVTGGTLGFDAQGLSSIYCTNSQVSGHSNIGFSAGDGARIDASGSDVTGGTTGYFAKEGAFVNAVGATIDSASVNGFWATLGGRIDATSGSATGCAGIGAYVLDDGFINFTGGTSTGNGTGVRVIDGGKINAEDAVISGNTGFEAQATNVGVIRVTGTGLTGTDVSPTLNTLGGTADQALVYT